MKIATLLPYKEDYTPKYSGAVSIHVSSLIKFSKFKNTTVVFGTVALLHYCTSNTTIVFGTVAEPVTR